MDQNGLRSNGARGGLAAENTILDTIIMIPGEILEVSTGIF